jgi:hypothetical protein
MICRVFTTVLSMLSAPSVVLMLSAPSVALPVIAAPSAAQAPAPKKTVEIVSVTGCLREQGTNWMLVAATEPTPSVANQAAGDDIPKAAPAGKNTFRLIGTSEFNLPQMKDKTVVIRGLFIKDKVSRINVTSAVEAVASCAPGAGK